MEKKYFEAPYLKVVRVHNDIIATSEQLGMGSSLTSGTYSAGVGERGDFDDEYEDWE